jgi:hypothetical protein
VRFGHVTGTSLRDYRLSIEHAPSELSVSVDGPVAVLIPGALSEYTRFELDRVDLRTESTAVNLDLTPLPGVSPPAFPTLDAESLGLHRLERIREVGRTADPVSSTVIGGTLLFPGLRRPTVALTSATDLWLRGSRGKLTIQALVPGALDLRFEGTIRGIRGGQQQMPSLLEELFVRHRPALITLAVPYLLVGAFAVFRRRTRIA